MKIKDKKVLLYVLLISGAQLGVRQVTGNDLPIVVAEFGSSKCSDHLDYFKDLCGDKPPQCYQVGHPDHFLSSGQEVVTCGEIPYEHLRNPSNNGTIGTYVNYDNILTNLYEKYDWGLLANGDLICKIPWSVYDKASEKLHEACASNLAKWEVQDPYDDREDAAVGLVNCLPNDNLSEEELLEDGTVMSSYASRPGAGNDLCFISTHARLVPSTASGYIGSRAPEEYRKRCKSGKAQCAKTVQPGFDKVGWTSPSIKSYFCSSEDEPNPTGEQLWEGIQECAGNPSNVCLKGLQNAWLADE